jgi:hypothetical protein
LPNFLDKCPEFFDILGAGDLSMKTALMVLLVLALPVTGLAQRRSAARPGAPSEIGLAVGQKAPAFSLHDQFGRLQTNETLEGPKGTVLLFFRSADW